MPIDVACLCAAWCQLCGSYAAVFAHVTAELAARGHDLRPHWIDIEDESELVGDLDIETFPTLVVVDPVAVRFAGVLTPQPETLRRILRATVAEAPAAASWSAVDAEFLAFADRLRKRLGRTG